MAGVYIPGMEMPTSCDECYTREKSTCPLLKVNVTSWGKPLNCPLVPVPPHGDLIDRDALKQEMPTCGIVDAYGTQVLLKIENAPTIIPADKEDT